MESENKNPIVKNKLAIIGSGILLVICMALFFPFPSNLDVGATVMIFSIPVQDSKGIKYLGIIGVVLFILALILLVKGLKKYKVRLVILVIVVYSLLPNLLISVYQDTLARGLQAVSYDGEGTCEFEYKSDPIMKGDCQFTLKNHSKEQVSFDLEFIDTSILDEDIFESLMNYGGPYKITLKSNEIKTIRLNETINVSTVPKQFDSATMAGIHFKLIDGKKERVM